MSSISILKSGLVASACVAGLTLTACASSGQNGSRYGGNVYDYESGGGNCGSNCGVVAEPVSSRYGSGGTVIGGQPVSPGIVYTDCSVVSGMNCNAQPAPVYTQPAPVYTAPTQTYGEPVACPAGTTPNGDGTCMESGSTTYSGGSTYTGMTTSYEGPVECPAGTTDNGDGTCMESGGYIGPNTSTTYGGSSTTYGEPVSCPTGTTANGDGTCMETGYVPTYSNPTNYMPIRK